MTADEGSLGTYIRYTGKSIFFLAIHILTASLFAALVYPATHSNGPQKSSILHRQSSLWITGSKSC